MNITQTQDLTNLRGVWEELFCQKDLSPFQTYPYCQLFADRFCRPDDIIALSISENDIPLGLAIFERVGTTALLLGMKPVLGKEEITDYGDILVSKTYHEDMSSYGQLWQAICDHLCKQGIEQLQLDYVRDDSKLWQYYQTHQGALLTPIEVAPFINLDLDWDTYLSSLRRVERKELKRKLKRLDTQNYSLIEMDSISLTDFADFIRLHRLSDSAKEKFMSEQMATFFQEVSALRYGCWQTKLWFLEIDGKRAAAAMGFVSDERILMYNSGFDPAFAYFSVGLLLHGLIMKKHMGSTNKTYDFMRGSERYKYDLGARDMQLFKIVEKLKG